MAKSKQDNSTYNTKEDEIKSLNSRIRQTAHDLNNIITSSKNSIVAVKQLFKPNDKVQKYFTNIETNNLRATEIIEELLASEGIGERSKRRINTKDLIDDVIRTLKGTIGKRIELITNIDKNLFKVNGFYSDLYRALLNLSINAHEAIKDKGKILIKVKNVSSKSKGTSVTISVKDTGCGISNTSLKFIFKEEYSTKNKKIISGLGLYIVKNTIDAHNGKIDVNSKVGRGTEFLVTLPAVEPVKKVKPKNKIKKILIAEDEIPILESISYLLESYDYETVCAANGEIALEKYKTNDDIDLMIIDKLMPNLDGIEVVQKIRKENKKIPIILTTGLQDADESKFKTYGVNKVIKKPYDFDLMIELIRNISI